jgi:hypothetical protein
MSCGGGVKGEIDIIRKTIFTEEFCIINKRTMNEAHQTIDLLPVPVHAIEFVIENRNHQWHKLCVVMF